MLLHQALGWVSLAGAASLKAAVGASASCGISQKPSRVLIQGSLQWPFTGFLGQVNWRDKGNQPKGQIRLLKDRV